MTSPLPPDLGGADAALRAFQEKFATDRLTVISRRHWIWSVRPNQVTLGAGLVWCRSPAADWSSITPEQAADLLEMFKQVEATLKAAFRPQRLNYLMLMMVDPHLHFHVLPRYAEPPVFAGRAWTDPAWPGPPEIVGASPDPRVQAEIVAALERAVAS